jgi:positive regulator of sigma E activity
MSSPHSAALLEHPGVIQRAANGKVEVAVATGGCSGCGHRSGCGIGQLAEGRQQTRITLAAPPGLNLTAGTQVLLRLPTQRLHLAALAGYLLPAITILFGTGIGDAWAGDGGAALGAIAGLFAGLLLGKLGAWWRPALAPEPELIVTSTATPSHSPDPYGANPS